MKKPKLLDTEIFSVKEDLNDWCFGTLVTDNYKGWINKKYLGPHQSNNYKITSRSSNIYLQPNSKSVVLHNLSLGSTVNVYKFENNWAIIYLKYRDSKTIGFIPCFHLSKILEYKYDFIVTSLEMLHIPYVWGGRSSNGIDCSALLQLSLQSIGINVPRNTNQQISFMKLSKNFKEVDLELLTNPIIKKGLVIFWPGHVGIMSKNNILIHANAFHMSVCEENIFDVFHRFENQYIFPSFVFELTKT